MNSRRDYEAYFNVELVPVSFGRNANGLNIVDARLNKDTLNIIDILIGECQHFARESI